jgi:hypothetical protein
MFLEKEEKVFCRILFKLRDEDGIIRCSPEFLQKELGMIDSDVEGLLEALCDKGVIVYITRTNKSTGEVLKIIQLL